MLVGKRRIAVKHSGQAQKYLRLRIGPKARIDIEPSVVMVSIWARPKSLTWLKELHEHQITDVVLSGRLERKSPLWSMPIRTLKTHDHIPPGS